MPNVSNIQYNGTTYGIEGVTDATLTISGRAADAAAVGAALARGSGLTEEAKQALLACFAQVAWIGDDGQDYYDALEAALYPPTNLVSISAVYTQSGTVYDTDTLATLKPDLVVTVHYDDSTTAVVTGYTLSGTLTEGTSTITVSFSGKTTTFNVAVTHWEPITVTITWSGSGVEKTSSVVDATEHDAFYTLPFVSGDTNLVSGATASTQGVKFPDAALYNDSACTEFAGYYQVDTGIISQTKRTGANSPWVVLDEKTKIIPSGYYGKFAIERTGSNENLFTSNAKMMSYLNAHGVTVILE